MEFWKEYYSPPALDLSNYLSRTSGLAAGLRTDRSPSPPLPPEQLARIEAQLVKAQYDSKSVGSKMQHDSSDLPPMLDQEQCSTIALERPGASPATQSLNAHSWNLVASKRESSFGEGICFNPNAKLHVRKTKANQSWQVTGNEVTIDFAKTRKKMKVGKRMSSLVAEDGFVDDQGQSRIPPETQKEATPVNSAPVKPLIATRIDLEDIAIDTLQYYDIPFETGAVSYHGQLRYYTLPLIVCDRNRIPYLF
jgi:hypothetical protein